MSGSNLAGVFKLVFKVARSDKNDSLFLEGNILGRFYKYLMALQYITRFIADKSHTFQISSLMLWALLAHLRMQKLVFMDMVPSNS